MPGSMNFSYIKENLDRGPREGIVPGSEQTSLQG